MQHWWIWAILFSIGGAGYFGINQQYKLKSETLVVWSGVGTAIVFSPLIIIYDISEFNTKFYIMAFIAGLIAAFLDNRTFDLVAKFGAGAISRLAPLAIALVCLIWWIKSPDNFNDLYSSKAKFSGICFCLMMSVAAAMMMKRDKISAATLKGYFPVIIATAFYSVLVKTIMSSNNLPLAGTFFMIIEEFISGMINGFIGCHKIGMKNFYNDIFSKNSFKAGIFIIIFISMLVLSRNEGMKYTENPAYVDIIGRGLPFLWILFFNKLKRIEDKTNIPAGIIFVISATGIILLSSL